MDAKAAERADDLADASRADTDSSDDPEITPRIPNRLPAWKPMTLQALFGSAEKPRACRPSVQVMTEEEELMALAEAEEDAVLDDGAIEIDSEDEFRA